MHGASSTRWNFVSPRRGLVWRSVRCVRDALRALRGEIRVALAAVGRADAINRYLASTPVRRINIGCGPAPVDGWLNFDWYPQRPEVLFVDARDRLPLPDCCADAVFSEHMVQELNVLQQRRFLAEVLRILKPGGVLRISIPDLARIVGTYAALPGTPEQRYLEWSVRSNFPEADAVGAVYAINAIFRACAGFIPDRDTFVRALRAAGFVALLECEVGVSEDLALCNLEAHGRVLGDEAVNAYESMVFEARKPGSAGRA